MRTVVNGFGPGPCANEIDGSVRSGRCDAREMSTGFGRSSAVQSFIAASDQQIGVVHRPKRTDSV